MEEKINIEHKEEWKGSGTIETVYRYDKKEINVMKWLKFNQIEVSIEKYGNKRTSHSSFCLHGNALDDFRKFITPNTTTKYSKEIIKSVIKENYEALTLFGKGCGGEVSKHKGNQECRETHLCKTCFPKYVFHRRIHGLLNEIVESLNTSKKGGGEDQ